jgi:hypothetical protein
LLTSQVQDNTDASPVIRCDRDRNYRFPLGTTSVTCNATDAAGNSRECSFALVVTDVEAPSLTCPTDIFASTNPGSAMATVSWSAPTVRDNSNGIVTLWSSRISGDNFALGLTSVLYTATDAYGNNRECVFNVVVADSEPPAITCPSDITVTTDPGTSGGIATWNLPTVSGE